MEAARSAPRRSSARAPDWENRGRTSRCPSSRPFRHPGSQCRRWTSGGRRRTRSGHPRACGPKRSAPGPPVCPVTGAGGSIGVCHVDLRVGRVASSSQSVSEPRAVRRPGRSEDRRQRWRGPRDRRRTRSPIRRPEVQGANAVLQIFEQRPVPSGDHATLVTPANNAPGFTVRTAAPGSTPWMLFSPCLYPVGTRCRRQDPVLPGILSHRAARKHRCRHRHHDHRRSYLQRSTQRLADDSSARVADPDPALVHPRAARITLPSRPVAPRVSRRTVKLSRAMRERGSPINAASSSRPAPGAGRVCRPARSPAFASRRCSRRSSSSSRSYRQPLLLGRTSRWPGSAEADPRRS